MARDELAVRENEISEIEEQKSFVMLFEPMWL